MGLAEDKEDIKIIQREFCHVATDASGDGVEAARRGIVLAKHFQAFIASSVGEDGIKIICARYCLDTITGPLQRDQIEQVTCALERVGFGVGSVSCDGAAENRSALKLCMAEDRGIPASEFLTPELQALCDELRIETTVEVAVQFNGLVSRLRITKSRVCA